MLQAFQTQTPIVALMPFFAQPGTALEGHTAVIGRALDRAIRVRAGDVQPPGRWHRGMMLPHLDDGSINYDDDAEVPVCDPRMMWIGGDGGA